MVNVFHAIDQISERLTTDRFDLAQMERGLDLPIINLAARIVVRHCLQRVRPQVARHHIEAAAQWSSTSAGE